MALGGQTISLGQLVTRLVFRSDTAALRRADRELVGLRQRISGIGATVGQVGLQLGLAGTAITGFTALAVREFTELDTQQARLRGQVGLTREELESYTPALREIGDEFGQTQSALLTGLFSITSAGIRGARAIETLRQAAQASASDLEPWPKSYLY